MKTKLEQIVTTSKLVLTEAAVIETLRRDAALALHPQLENTLLIYDPRGRRALETLHRSFITLAQQARVPILVTTPTWRANRERLQAAGVGADVNSDAALFLKRVRSTFPEAVADVFVGGLIGCKNDCYTPAQALTATAAETFHRWQIEKLAGAGLDFLLAATLPAVSEAEGIACAMGRTGVPYLISFVIGPDARILDGTRLDAAFRRIDRVTGSRPPLGYMVNCAYPTFLQPARQTEFALGRLVGYQANASSKSQHALDGSDRLQMDDMADWGARMIELNRQYGIRILGGCCGTGLRHLAYLVQGAR